MSRMIPPEPRVPLERWIGIALFGFALILFGASISWTAFPGLPTRMLLGALGLETAPQVLNPLWNGVVRFFSRHSALPVASWMGLFSVVCGAIGVGVMGRLMVRVGYQIRGNPPPVSVVREAQARRLSGLVAGLYLASCIPYGVASTRSLPETFHLLLLLLAVWFFAEYRRGGSRVYLGLLGFLYGLGIVESATFLAFFPVAVFLVAREGYRRQELLAKRPHLIFWGSLAAGLRLYPLQAVWLFRQGASAGLFGSPWQAWGQILQEQFWLIVKVRFAPGFLVIMFFAWVPWLMLFVMSRRSPWFYETDQVLMRLVLAGGLLGILFNAPFSFWNLLGMNYLMVTPYLLLASCMGYMAGEFWILGEVQMRDTTKMRRGIRKAAGIFAWLLPLLVLAGGVYNRPVVDGRYGADVKKAALEILDRLKGRDILISGSVRDEARYPFLDDALRLAAWERRAPVRVINAQQMASPLCLKQLASVFDEDLLKQPLLQGDFGMFAENLLLSASGPGRVAILDLPDLFRPFAYLAPDGFIYRLETTPEQVDLPALIKAQRPFWNWMEQMGAHPAPPSNLARPYQDLLRIQASKVANNLGVMQAERGDEAGALETFREVGRIFPENISMVLNWMALEHSLGLPEDAELESEWAALQEKLDGDRWMLALRYGYVWRAREWLRRGWVWALSGVPATEEAISRNPSTQKVEETEFAQWMDRIYLRWGASSPGEIQYRARLMQNGKDTEALMELCRLALYRKDLDVAKAYLAEARAMGLPEDEMQFDQAMIDFVGGEPERARKTLMDLSRSTAADARVWMALVMMTGAEEPVNRQAMKTLKNPAFAGIQVRLALAWVHLLRLQWSEAQSELSQAVRVDIRNSRAWELSVVLAQIMENQPLMQASLRNLLALEPLHPFQYMNKAEVLYRAGTRAEAEAEIRTGLRQDRNPSLLNRLAQYIMEGDGDLHAARSLVEEALQKQPFNPIFRCTRSELNLKEGRVDEAWSEIQQVLACTPNDVQASVILAQIHFARGESGLALELARALMQRKKDLSAEQRKQLEKIIQSTRKI